MSGNVTADVPRSSLSSCTKNYSSNGSGLSPTKRNHFNDSRTVSQSRFSPKFDRSPMIGSRYMGGGASIAHTAHASPESRPLPPGASGPQGPRGEIMSKSSLPRKSDLSYGSRSASTTPSYSYSRNLGNSMGRRTGSHTDLRMPSISQKTSLYNGRSPVSTIKATNSLSRSRRLTGSNSTLNSAPLNDNHVSEPSTRASHFKSSYSTTTPYSGTRSDIDNLSLDLELHANLDPGTNDNNFDSRGSDNASGRNVSSSNRDRMERRGLVGLKNLGNTCFMNSVLQCLSNSRLLLEYCLNKSQYPRDINVTTSSMKGSLFNAYAELMQKMWSSNLQANFVTPTSFKAQIQRFAPRFMGYSQQDAQEFLRYLLQGLHEDVNRVKKKEKPIIPNYEEEDKLPDEEKSEIYWKRYRRQENSYLQDIFTGQLKSTLKCDECNYCSTTFDPFWDLSLPIPKRSFGGTAQSLEDCLRLFTTVEVLDGDEKPTCARCKARRRCTKSFSIQTFPKLLVLHLKRFSGERHRSKIQSRIEYPVTGLDLSTFCADSCKQTQPIYDLYAVSCHSGSVHSGHYTAFCQHAYNGEWYDFDDTRVSAPLPVRSVISSEGYVLFYELKSS